MYVHIPVGLKFKITEQLRHSQPEFSPKNLRDAATGYAEMGMKGWNAALQEF